jgi:hypothetical protein
MTRTTARYLALLALATILFHWKTLLTDQFTSIVGGEFIDQSYGWLQLWVKSLWSGHLPLWDPYAFGGRPWTEEMAAFYPIHLLFALIPLNRNDVISPRFFHEYLAFNRFLGACFMFALLRELRCSHFAAFIGACAFSMGGMFARLPWPQYMESCIWLPAIFLFLLRALRAENRGRALLEAAFGGLSMGMTVLAGGAQFAMIQSICIIAGLAYYGAVCPASPDAPAWSGRAHWIRLAGILATILFVALGAGAAQLLPSIEYAHLSLRSISGGWLPMDEKIPWDRLVRGMWPQSIVTALFPAGAPAGGEEAWPWYVGAFPFFLAVTAIWKCWKNVWVRFLSFLIVFAYLYTLGEFSPLFGVLYAAVPWLWMTRSPSRFVYLISFALAALSAFGLDSMLQGAGHSEAWAPARPFLKWVAIACAAALILPDIFTQITPGIWTSLSLLLIIASCAWFFRLTLRPSPSSVRVLLAAFILFDLGVFNWLEADKNQLAKTGDEYVRMLSLRRPSEFVKAQPGLHRVAVSLQGSVNIGDIYGVQSVWGGGATTIADFSQLRPHQELLNVRYHIKPASTPDPGAIYRDEQWKVYEDQNGYPRAWLVHQTILEPSHDAVFRRIDKPGADFHNVAIIETPLPRNLDPNTAGDSVLFRSYEADSMSIDVNTAGTALLVVSEVFYPGWKATVNGQPAEIRKTDGALRGIVVPGGFSHVVMEYSPASFYTGIGLSLLTAACVMTAWILLWRRRRAG